MSGFLKKLGKGIEKAAHNAANPKELEHLDDIVEDELKKFDNFLKELTNDGTPLNEEQSAKLEKQKFEEAEDNYVEWMKRKQSITKTFIDDMASILHLIETEKLKHSAIFEFTENEYPIALKMFIGGKITIESLRILDDFTEIIDKWKIHPSVRYIWDDELRRVTKLTGFVKYDKIKLSKIFDAFKEEIAE